MNLAEAKSLTPEQIVAMFQERDSLVQKVKELSHELSWFKRQMFGQKSERRLLELGGAKQLSLGEVLEFVSEIPAETETVKQYHRRLAKRPLEDAVEDTGLRFDSSVPVREIEVLDPSLEGLKEGEDYEVVSTKTTHRLAQEPGAYVVLKYTRKVTKLRDGTLKSPAAPDSPLMKSYADVSLLAGLLVDKMRYHLPLNRLHQRLSDCGIALSRMTLTNLTKRSIELLSPIYYAQLSSVLESAVLAMDETPIRAGRSPGGGSMHQGYFWPVYGDKNEVCFSYAPTRAQGVVKKILGEYAGVLLSDGYSAYERFAEKNKTVTHALCWAHTRRNFIESEKEEPELSREAIKQLREIYEIEEFIRETNLRGEEKLLYRAEHSRPLVESFFIWLKAQAEARVLLPSGAFTKAASYALRREPGLMVFLEHPDVPLDTNHLERALRPIPMGKKNWLFCSTELGAEHVGKIQSLIQTCRLHDVDVYTYLVDVLQRIDSHPVRDVHLLTPRMWKENFAANPFHSDLQRVKNGAN